MTTNDCRGLPLTASGHAAVEAYDRAVEAYLANDPAVAARVDEIMLADPGMPMAHCLKGYLLTLAGQPGPAARVGESLDAAHHLSAHASPRERAHIAALAAWQAGDIRRAIDLLESILVDFPRDILAFRLAHYLHFFIGENELMRDSAARVLPFWGETLPGYGYVLGCRAFGLEETGDYVEAERLGRRAVEINPFDIWAGHAVAHVYEMQGRFRDGIAWIDRHENVWSSRNAFANHVWWHRALYYLEMEDYDAVVDHFDRLVWRAPSEDNLDVTNAIALLKRLEMRGQPVGDRWDGLAEIAARRAGWHNRPFNDAHFVLALVEAGRREEARRMVDGWRDYAAAHETTIASTMREVSIPLGEAIVACGAGEYGRAVDLMLPIRYRWRALGGSWAQRDVFARLLIDAAERAGRDTLARALLAERVASKPFSVPAWTSYARALDATGEAALAAAAEARAEELRAAF